MRLEKFLCVREKWDRLDANNDAGYMIVLAPLQLELWAARFSALIQAKHELQMET